MIAGVRGGAGLLGMLHSPHLLERPPAFERTSPLILEKGGDQ